MTDQDKVFNAKLLASVRAVFRRVFETDQITRSDVQQLILFIRRSQEILPEDLENIHLIIKLLHGGQLQLAG